LNCLSVSDEPRSQNGTVFNEVGPDEQNARGPMEAVSDLGTKSLLSSEERRCGRSYKVDRRTHALVRYSGASNVYHHHIGLLKYDDDDNDDDDDDDDVLVVILAILSWSLPSLTDRTATHVSRIPSRRRRQW